MSVGDNVRTVFKFLDGGLVLGYRALVYRVLDLGLDDGAVVFDFELVLRQLGEAPCPVGIDRSGSGVFLSAVSQQDNGDALRTDAVFVVRVGPLLDAFDIHVFRSMGIGDDVAFLRAAGNFGRVPGRYFNFLNGVLDLYAVVLLVKVCPGVLPFVAHVQLEVRTFDCHAVSVKSDNDLERSDIVRVVVIVPDLTDRNGNFARNVSVGKGRKSAVGRRAGEGVALGNAYFCPAVYDLCLRDRAVFVNGVLPLRQAVEALLGPAVRLGQRHGLARNVFAVGNQLHDEGRWPDVVLVVIVVPDFLYAGFNVFRRMGVGDLVRTVFEFLDGGLVLGHRALVYRVLDLGLRDRTGSGVERIIVFRKIGEAPRPVACRGRGGGIFLSTVGLEDNGNAGRTDAVFIVSVGPLFDTAHVNVLGSMFVGNGSDFAVKDRADELVLIGRRGLGPGVCDQRAGSRVVLRQVGLGVSPVPRFVQRDRITQSFAVGVKLNLDAHGSDLILVVLVVPDLPDSGLGGLGVDHVVAFGRVSCNVVGYLILNDGVNDLHELAVNFLIFIKVRERPAPVGSGGYHVSAGVNAVSVQMYSDGLGARVVSVFAVVPDFFAFDIDNESVGDFEAFDDIAAYDLRVGLDHADVAAHRVLGDGVLDLIGGDLLGGAHAVLAQMREGVLPVAGGAAGDLNGLGQRTVSVQVDDDGAGTGVAGVIVVLPDLADREVDVRRNVSVDDFDIAVFMFDVFAIVSVHDIFFEGVLDLVAVVVELGQILEAPLPVVRRGNGNAVDLRGAFHQVDGDADRTDAAIIAVIVPGLETVLGNDRGGVGEGDGSVLVVFHGLGGDSEGNVRHGVAAVRGGNVFIGNYSVAGNEVAARFGYGVGRAFGQFGKRRGLAVRKRELYVGRAVGKRGERVLGAAYSISIGSVRSKVRKYDVERERGGVACSRAFQHLGDLESALGRIDLGVGDRCKNDRRVFVVSHSCGLTGLICVADFKSFYDSLFDLIVQIGVGNVSAGTGSNRRKVRDTDGLAALDHERRADAVLKVHIAVQAGNVRRHLRQCAVGVESDRHEELAVKVFLSQLSLSVGGQYFLDVQCGLGRIDFVVGNGDRDSRSRSFKRTRYAFCAGSSIDPVSDR